MAMSVYRGHWLRAKALKDRWEEEITLLQSEMMWTRNFFDHKAHYWDSLFNDAEERGKMGAACYAARQRSIYRRLRDNCGDVFDT